MAVHPEKTFLAPCKVPISLPKVGWFITGSAPRLYSHKDFSVSTYLHGQAGADEQVRVCICWPHIPQESLHAAVPHALHVPPGGHVVVGVVVVVDGDITTH